MDNFRSVQAQDYGILRKKEERDEELFVFGYSCKVYEDYDKSLYVDQGKHLIPWLGDETLKIDRYDCRGALSDLTPFLPKSEGFDKRAALSNEERRIEQLCDQERFRALTVNEDEEILSQEEELKRLQKALNTNEKSYSEVAYSYDDDTKPTEENVQKETVNEVEDENFIPPYQLDVPVGMKIPKTKKHHEIIEKTAFFINEQGPQMEILLKIKQAENAQFNFLSFDNELHPYYRHLLMAVKSQRYRPTIPSASSPVTETFKDGSNEDTYLHPSLVQNSSAFTLPESAPTIPSINYKPSVDCSYSALVNRIKESRSAINFLDGLKKNEAVTPVAPTALASSNTETLKRSPSKSATHSAENSDNFSNSTSPVPLSALTKSARRRRIRKEKTKAAAASFKIYYADEEIKKQQEDTSPENKETIETNEVSEKNDACDSTTDMIPMLKPVPAPAPVIEIPPSDLQLIVDKMASYVAKNGRDFEDVVRSKGDPRFAFIDKNHKYNSYYNQKVELYLQLEDPLLISSSTEQQSSDDKNTDNSLKQADHSNPKKPIIKVAKSQKHNKPIPICFSIKKPKDQETLEVKSALPYEESEGEEVDGENEEGNKEKSNDTEERCERSTETENSESVLNVEITAKPETPVVTATKKNSEMTLEKWAQERLKAKLVVAAKEKLAAKDKDKQLQAERRKKAAEFINLLQKENPTNKVQMPEVSNNNLNSNGKKETNDVITILSDTSSSDSDSVVSVPLSSDDDGKLRHSKRKLEELDPYYKKKRKKEIYSEDRQRHRRSPKIRSHASSRSRSPSNLKRSHVKHKKYDKEKHFHSKKKHHHRSKDKSSYDKKNHKDRHRSRRSKYSDEDTEYSDSADSYSSNTDISKRV